jgi:nucleoside-diphosphate-sugar epimerase
MEALGYEPTIDRKEGIALTWKWLQDSAFGAD